MLVCCFYFNFFIIFFQNAIPKTAEARISISRHTTSGDFPIINSVNVHHRQVSETSGVGLNVLTMKATSGRPGKSLKYAIAGGNVGNTFALTESGELKTTENLDYEQTSSFNLWLEASDTGNPPFSSYHNIELTIIDENDNPPVFENSYHNATILEGTETTIPLVVATVTADDADSGKNAEISYRFNTQIEAEIGAKFSVDETTGVIQCVSHLDREEQDSFTLLVEAVDQVSNLRNHTIYIHFYVITKL